MAWVRLDDKFRVHPKILSLTPTAGWLWVCGLAYSNDHCTEGNIPARGLSGVAPVLKNPIRQAEELVGAGLWVTTKTGWQIHDYHDYQMTAEEVQERRETRTRAGRLGGLRSGEVRRSKAEAKCFDEGKQTRSKNERNANPVPVPLLETEPRTTSLRSRATPNGFSEESKSILEWLNDKAGKHFAPVETHLRLIDARLKKHAPWVLRKVVTVKVREWGDDEKARVWLRPKTLFNETNFENYVGELPPESTPTGEIPSPEETHGTG